MNALKQISYLLPLSILPDPAKPINHTLYIIGFEYQRYLNVNSFLYAHLDTMYSGLRSGFMDMFVGYGRNFLNSEYINFFAKFGIGAAGGRIFPENGLRIILPEISPKHLNRVIFDFLRPKRSQRGLLQSRNL